MTDWIDLRSDTVTCPTAGMRKAMYEAEVGDDVYGEDPTVNALEAHMAELLGKEAGLFVASGTQSNLIALLTHCQRGDEYIAGSTAHTYQFEGGGGAALGGIQPQTMSFEADGTLDLATVERLIKPDNVHFARTRLLCTENTQSGKPTGPDYFCRAREMVDRHGLALHLDGARYFNAVVATGASKDAIADPCDTVSICLSKGLGAPVGSVLVGPGDFIEEARRWRKMVGGGMRQAGVIAAAGLYALEHHIDRLSDDHEKASRIAAAFNERYQGAATASTNMVFIDLPDTETDRLVSHFADHRIRIGRERWVFHLDVSFEDVDRIVTALRQF
jgi:threonine aldolase